MNAKKSAPQDISHNQVFDWNMKFASPLLNLLWNLSPINILIKEFPGKKKNKSFNNYFAEGKLWTCKYLYQKMWCCVPLADHAQPGVIDISVSKCKDDLHEVPQRIALGLVVFIKFINELDDDTKRIIIKFAVNFKQQETAS